LFQWHHCTARGWVVLSESDVAEKVVPFVVGRDVGARPYLLGQAIA
jgi:hypothetical protein